jgi:hypothetical protein
VSTLLNKIFVSIVSYRDSLLYQTVEDLLDKASKPDLLVLGIVEQSVSQTEGLKRICDKYGAELRYIHMPPKCARGCAWARAICQQLYLDEPFYFQIDSHTLFDKAWDYNLLQQYFNIHETKIKFSNQPNKADDIVLSSYPNPFTKDGKTKYSSNTTSIKIIKGHAFVDGYYCRQILDITDSSAAVRGHFVSGGMIFASSEFVKRIPYDNHYYFEEDELSIALKLFTHNIDVYHIPNNPTYHLYTNDETKYRPQHWDDHAQAGKMRVSSHERMKEMINDGSNMGKHYRLGEKRNLQQFEDETGLDVRNVKVVDSSKATIDVDYDIPEITRRV